LLQNAFALEIRFKIVQRSGQRTDEFIDFSLADDKRRRDELNVAVLSLIGTAVVQRDAVFQAISGQPRRGIHGGRQWLARGFDGHEFNGQQQPFAAQGDAPKFLAALNPRGVPSTAILWLSALIGIVIVLNYVMPNGLLEMLIYLIVAALLITWSIIIIVTHWKFRQHHMANNTAGSLLFKAPLAPVSNVLGMAYILFVVVVMCSTPNSRASALMIPVWLLGVWALFTGLQRKAVRG